jgi:hypothetical protein
MENKLVNNSSRQNLKKKIIKPELTGIQMVKLTLLPDKKNGIILLN